VSLRLRVTLFVSLLVAAAVVVVSWASYAAARNEARNEIDEFLRGRGSAPGFLDRPDFPEDWPRPRDLVPSAPAFRSQALVQVVDADGVILFRNEESPDLPITDLDLAVAAGASGEMLRDVDVDGTHYRMITVPIRAPAAGDELVALQVARDLTETDALLADLRTRLLLIGSAAVFAVAGASWFVSRRALRPVGLLTDAAEHVAATRDLDVPIEVDRRDEIGRLAGSFNTMLAALASSREQQRRLVADAGHELRTPLTSLRTNIEVLARADHMEPTERAELLADATAELEQLSELVGELVDLAGDAARDEPASEVYLADVVAVAVERLERRTGRRVTVTGTGGVVAGRTGRLARALANLLDNADKWGHPDTPIEVALEGGRIEVRDHGPGIDEDDLPHVFERFYRATAARTLPGSGLGLAIVEQVAREHGGSVFAVNAPGGGALVGFEIPAA
jgi:two-component system sensor histidine kinase MprB